MNTKRHKVNLLLLILMLTTVVVSKSYGQTTDLTGLREYLERNEELLMEAEALVRTTNSTKARTSLQTARQLQEAAKKNFVAGQMVLAAKLARLAREAILKSIQLAKREAKMEAQAQKAIEYAGRRNEQARTLFDESGQRDNALVRKLIDESINQLLRARTNMRQHMFEVAFQSANASVDLSDRAIRLLKRDTIGPELVRREIARTDQLLDRIDERVDSITDRELIRYLDEAYRLQDRARSDATAGRYIMAFEETKRARNIARKIMGQIGGASEANQEAVARTLDLTDTLIERAYEIARDQKNANAIRRLDEAFRLQQNAHDAFRNGQVKQALRLTQRAREIARNTLRKANKDIDKESVRQTLERTDQILARLGDALAGAEDDVARELFDRASGRQTAAWEAFSSGDLKKALANTKVARNLAKTALQQLDNDQT